MTMNSTSIAKQQTGAMAFGTQIGYTPEYVQLVKDTYAKDATDIELQMFLEVCHQSKLNPFKKEIYFWKQSGKVIIHTGIDGYRLTADRTGRYAPGPPIKRTYDGDNNHTASTAYVRKKVGTDWFVIEETAFMNEWKKDSPFWKSADKASHQLDITAERHALRKAFPSSFPTALSSSSPDGSAPLQLEESVETPEQAQARAHLTENLLKIGKLFTTNEQYAALEATIKVSGLPVLEERYTNALIKLREYVLGKVGAKLQGEAFSAFIVATFPNGIDATEADEFFAALEKLEKVEPGEVVETPAEAAPAPAETESVEDAEAAAIAAEAISPEEAALETLREEVMAKLMELSGGDHEAIDKILDGRVVPNMTKPQLEKFLATISSDAPF